MPTTVREMINLIQKAGWVQVPGGKGSHRKFHHPTHTNTIIVPGQLFNTLKPGTESDIRKAAGMK